MTQEEFLLNTLEYYCADTSRRCISKDGGCLYSPKEAITTGNGCAIGRHLADNLKENLDTASVHGTPIRINQLFDEYRLEELLAQFPKELKDLKVDFLSSVQSFHDNFDYWCYSGLTEEGKTRLENMIARFNLNKEKFQKYLN